MTNQFDKNSEGTSPEFEKDNQDSEVEQNPQGDDADGQVPVEKLPLTGRENAPTQEINRAELMGGGQDQPSKEKIPAAMPGIESARTQEIRPSEVEVTKPSPEGKKSSVKDEILMDVRNLKKYFPIKKGFFSRTKGYVKAVDDISFYLKKGETLGMVGESGCGKTTAGRTILKLIPPTSGDVLFEGKPVFRLGGRSLLNVRKEMQIIFQDPFSSLNPRMTVGGIVGEGMLVHRLARGQELEDRVRELLKVVGLSPEYANRYPHEFSGGQRQRIGIARALSVNPKFIVCDESVSALDVSIQAQIINLLKDLQQKFDLSYLFIAHDLSVVDHISDRIAVMYLGRMVELAPAKEIYRNPRHPYTRALLSAIPVPDPTRKAKRIILEGDVPTPINPPSGCPFHTRCPIATADCTKEFPGAVQIGSGHIAHCIYADQPELAKMPVPEF